MSIIFYVHSNLILNARECLNQIVIMVVLCINYYLGITTSLFVFTVGLLTARMILLAGGFVQ